MSWPAFAQTEIRRLLTAFYTVNLLILLFVFVVWIIEETDLAKAPCAASASRVVTERVMLALIAASAAQLGALALSTGRRLARP